MVGLGTFSLGTLLGLLLGAFLGHALAIRRGKDLAKNNAAIELKKVFVPALDKLEHGDNQFEVMKDYFKHQYDTSINYSAYLKGKELASFKKALKSYKHWQNTMYGRSTSEVFYGTEDPEFLDAQSRNPVDLINSLLKHVNK
ncbi:MAG: hypothetical protein ACI90A_001044 [Shewanella sp.]|jgi:hypothetical protein